MDPENLRTIVTGLVTAAVALVPAWLLYRQNERSGQREAATRKAERDSEERRRDQDLQRERLSLDAGARQAAERERRERFTRFLRVVQQIDTGIHGSSATGRVYPISEAERIELALAYEDLALDRAPDLRERVKDVRQDLDRLIAGTGDSGSLDSQRMSLQFSMDALRDRVRTELDGNDAINSTTGQEPATP